MSSNLGDYLYMDGDQYIARGQMSDYSGSEMVESLWLVHWTPSWP